MNVEKNPIEAIASVLQSRREKGSPRVAAQIELLDSQKFIDLLSLAGLIPEPEDKLGYSASSEAVYIRAQLHKQINEMICELVRHRADFASAEPLHRLPAHPNAAASQDRGHNLQENGPSALVLQQVFPTRLDGWLTIPRGDASRAPRKRGTVPASVRIRTAEDMPLPCAFETALGENPGAIESHLDAYLESLRLYNGVLPIVVRCRAHQEQLRGLEMRQIELGFGGADRGDLVERGGLARLCQNVLALENPADGDESGRTSAGSADLDQHLPLASLWSLALRAFAAMKFGNDRSSIGRPSTDSDLGCCPPLTIAHVEDMRITLNAGEIQSAIALLRSLPPNSFIEIFNKSEILRHRKGSGPLKDWLIGVKDVFAFGPTTAASSILDPFVSQLEATAVRRLRDAGCLIVGKTNLDEFALGSSSETSAFKPTPGCPSNRLCVAGGSSGGSASAVAAGLVRIALGSDTAGSIRVPAAYCGVVGWKPSYGVVSRNGLLSLSSGLDVVGLLARNVDDCIAAASVMIGEDAADETTASAPNLDFQTTQHECAKKEPLEVGVPIEYFLNVARPLLPLYEELIGTQDWERLRDIPRTLKKHPEGMSIERDVPGALDDRFRTIPEYWQVFRDMLDSIATQGWTWKLVSLPHTWLSIPAYFSFSRAELASSLHRYDGTAFGARSGGEFRELKSRIRQSQTRQDHFGIQPKLRILMGIHALQLPLAIKKQESNKPTSDDGLLDNFLDLAKRARQAICDDFDKVFQHVDLLLTPVVNVAAPPYGGIVDSIAQQRLDELTVPANHAGVPAISLPWGTIESVDDSMSKEDDRAASARLPNAIQVIAPRFQDVQLLAVAKRLETIRDETACIAKE